MPWSRIRSAAAKALQILAGKAGIYGMIGGQVVDVEADGTAGLRRRSWILSTG